MERASESTQQIAFMLVLATVVTEDIEVGGVDVGRLMAILVPIILVALLIRDYISVRRRGLRFAPPRASQLILPVACVVAGLIATFASSRFMLGEVLVVAGGFFLSLAMSRSGLKDPAPTQANTASGA